MKKALIVIIAIGLFIKFFGLGNVLYMDENAWAIDSANYFKSGNFIGPNVPHPPIPLFVYSVSSWIFGGTDFGLRLVPLLFSLLLLYFVYNLSKEKYGEEQALTSVAIMMFSFWAFIASLQVDIDGAILSCFLAGSFYYLLKSENSKENLNLLLSGLFLGLALLSKLQGAIGVVIIAIYLLFRSSGVLNYLKKTSIIFFTALALFSIVFYSLYLINPSNVASLVGYNSQKIHFNFSPLSLIYFLLWGTPLFIGLLLFNNYDRKDLLFYSWVFITIFVYFLVGVPNMSPYDRYLMPIIPAIAIIGGKTVYEYCRQWKSIVSLATIILFFMYLVNLRTEFIPHGISNYIDHIKHFDLNFYFPITGSSGPTFGINFEIILLIFFISALLIYFSFTSRRIGRGSIVAFIALNLAFNIFLIMESSVYLSGPDISYESRQALRYSTTLTGPIYTNFMSTSYYTGRISDFHSTFNLETNKDNLHFFDYNEGKEFISEFKQDLDQNGGNVVFFNYPTWDQTKELYLVFSDCLRLKEFIDKNYLVAVVYQCNAK